MIIVIHICMIFIVLLGVGVMVATKNLAHAAYALCLTLIGIAGIYVLLAAELLAVVQIMLYAGGVVILLAFGIMMTNRLKGDKVLSESRNQVLGAIISLAVFAGLCYLISSWSILMPDPSDQNQVKTISLAFLTDHIVAFELIAFILLVALVGAAYLSKNAANE